MKINFYHSELANVDRDANFLTQNRHSTCDYYNDISFNENFYGHDNFSLFHVNIQSLPQTLIAIYENCITNINREIYHLTGYAHKNSIREQRAEGGGGVVVVSLFIKNDIHFQVRDNININLPDVDILFIEIPKEYITDLHTYAFVNLRKNGPLY